MGLTIADIHARYPSPSVFDIDAEYAPNRDCVGGAIVLGADSSEPVDRSYLTFPDSQCLALALQ
jgi:hypothetical protein